MKEDFRKTVYIRTRCEDVVAVADRGEWLHPVAQSTTIPRRRPNVVLGKQESKNIMDSWDEKGTQQLWLCARLSVTCDSQPNPIGQLFASSTTM